MSLVFALWSVSYPLHLACLFSVYLCLIFFFVITCLCLVLDVSHFFILLLIIFTLLDLVLSLFLPLCLSHMLCAFCSFFLLPTSLSFFLLCELWLFVIFSPFVGLTFYLFLILVSHLLFLLFILDFPFLHILSASLGPFSFFCLLCVPQCLFVLCDFPFQCLSSLCTPILLLFFFYPVLGFSVSSWVCVSLFHILQLSFLAYFLWTCVYIPMCACLCMFVTKGCPNPFPVGAECLLSK